MNAYLKRTKSGELSQDQKNLLEQARISKSEVIKISYDIRVDVAGLVDAHNNAILSNLSMDSEDSEINRELKKYLLDKNKVISFGKVNANLGKILEERHKMKANIMQLSKGTSEWEKKVHAYNEEIGWFINDWKDDMRPELLRCFMELTIKEN